MVNPAARVNSGPVLPARRESAPHRGGAEQSYCLVADQEPLRSKPRELVTSRSIVPDMELPETVPSDRQ